MDIAHGRRRLLGGLSAAGLHAPPLAEEAAAGARRASPTRCRGFDRRQPVRAGRRATTSNRALVDARTASAGRCARADSRAARCRRWRRRAGRCWCRASTCTTMRRTALLQRFRFVARRAARRRHDLVCAATAAASARTSTRYDVFLLQVAGQRRWRIGRAARPAPARRRAAEDARPASRRAEDWLLEPGDMLYLPPGWGHDGVAVGACLTASIGFRAPAAGGLARRRCCSASPTPPSTRAMTPARRAAPPIRSTPTGRSWRPIAGAASRRRCSASPTRRSRAVGRCAARPRALGEALSEPKPGTWFERAAPARLAGRRSSSTGKQPHALRRRSCLPQRRGVPRRRTRCDTDAHLRRRAPARAGGARSPERRGPRAARPLGRGRLVPSDEERVTGARRMNERQAEPDRLARAILRGDPRRLVQAADAGASEICLVDPDFARLAAQRARRGRVARPLGDLAPQAAAVRAQLRRAARSASRASPSGAGSGRTSCSAATIRTSRRSRSRRLMLVPGERRGAPARSGPLSRHGLESGQPIRLECRETIDALLQRSVEAFPVDDPGALGNSP